LSAHRWSVDVAIGIVSVAAIAIASFLLEQLVLEGWPGVGVYVHVVGWLVGVGGAWIALLWIRSRLSATAGTLYYVRMLDPSMTDWHEAAERHAQREYLQLFEVSRDTLMEERDGVIDVRSQRRRAFEYLEELFNADDQRTGFTVAPNMLWPVAFGLGYRAALRPGAKLLDFGVDSTSKFTWEPDAGAGPGLPVTTRTEAAGAVEGAAVLVTLTTQAQASWPQWLVGQKVRVGRFADDGTVQGLTVGSEAQDVDPKQAAETWVGAIREALHDRDGPVLLAAQAPKTVAFAAGYLLGQMPRGEERTSLPGCGLKGCQRPGCHNPWRYLVPLYWDRQQRRYVPVWAVDGQTDPRTLLAELGAER
jgi:hypothetical protein